MYVADFIMSSCPQISNKPKGLIIDYSQDTDEIN